ncbi:MAG: GNAT family N-acetyltransferase [Gemmatimonadaceae bacterium]|nr:GNAT family N-acetyltransferase [Gemmatimonadaceae bacterium]
MTTSHAEHAVAPSIGAGLSVREATAGDVDTVATLRLTLLREYATHPVYGRLHAEAEARAAELCARQLASERDAFFIAEIDGIAVGLLRCSESLASPLLEVERFAYLSSVYVRPAFRRAGVLRALLARADAWCGERGLTEMRLHNVPDHAAAAAWTALGFDVVEEVRTRSLAGR